MDILSDDLQEVILHKLFYKDFLNSSFLFNSIIVEKYKQLYKKSVKTMEKWICKRRYYHNGDLCWITKFNYHNVNGHKLFYNLKYDNSYIRGEIVFPLMNISDNCHHHCRDCGYFYPTIFCLIMCRHYCNCYECNRFARENIIGGFVLKCLSAKYISM